MDAEKEEINRALTEALGKCWHEWQVTTIAAFPNQIHNCKRCREEISIASETPSNPDYCSDLNAMADVEREIDRRGEGLWLQYVEALLNAIAYKFGLFSNADARHWHFATASAETRARAAYEILKEKNR